MNIEKGLRYLYPVIVIGMGLGLSLLTTALQINRGLGGVIYVGTLVALIYLGKKIYHKK